MGTRGTKRAKNIRIVMIILIVAVATAVGFGIFMANYKPIKKVHFSIDDATLIFQDIQYHQYDSIFDNTILNDLQELHEKYGIVVTLYVFGELEDYAIWDTSLDYKNEFRANSNWLKIGFHSGSDLTPEKDYADSEEFEEKFLKVESAIRRMSGETSLAHVLRLHYWYATDEVMDVLKREGINGLLCSDSSCGSYNLTSEQVEKLNTSRDGVLEVNGFFYYRTDMRLENVDNVREFLSEHKKDRVMVIFTHAWCFEKNKGKLEETLSWLTEQNYEFTDLYTENK